jgi:hypothetical protein
LAVPILEDERVERMRRKSGENEEKEWREGGEERVERRRRRKNGEKENTKIKFPQIILQYLLLYRALKY